MHFASACTEMHVAGNHIENTFTCQKMRSCLNWNVFRNRWIIMSAARLWVKVAVQTVFPRHKVSHSLPQPQTGLQACGSRRSSEPEYQSENRRANPNKAEGNPKGKDRTEVEKAEVTNVMGSEEWWGKKQTQEKGQRTADASNHGREGDCSGERKERTRTQRSV